MNPYGVAKGQIWVDCDPRQPGGRTRYLQVLSVEGEQAVVQGFYYAMTAGRKARVPLLKTRIKLSRFKPIQTGYRRVS